MKKIAVFAFQGELMCFAHALLNTIDLSEKGYEVQLIIEGGATKLIAQLAAPETPFHKQYSQVIEKKLLAGVCKACAGKMGTLEEARKQELPLLDDMSGHPGFAHWLGLGYEIISM
ncbi:MAG: cytoplasmic protein [Candidatus Riflebacteria bacterium]|jgi:hypothetical protein|nr:cytoplasmic protein [Candidatus Riflebacteria bacterium]